MGCWGIGGQWGPVDDQQAIKTIHAARDAGVNLFDTADAYGFGRSEELVGKAFGRFAGRINALASSFVRRIQNPER